MKRKKCLRAVLEVCSAVLLTLGMLPSAALQTQAGNSNKIQQGGVHVRLE